MRARNSKISQKSLRFLVNQMELNTSKICSFVLIWKKNIRMFYPLFCFKNIRHDKDLFFKIRFANLLISWISNLIYFFLGSSWLFELK